MQPLRLILLGSPGSGKGTVSKLLFKKYQINQISTGDLFRNEIQNHSNLGLQVQEIIARGDLVDDALTNKILFPHLDNTRSFLLDGYPRNITQAKLLDKYLIDNNIKIDYVINLAVPQNVIISRISNRWIHAPSGRTYNLEYNRPRVEGHDDITGDPLVKRNDDDAVIVKQRLERYHKDTEPLIDFYKKSDRLVQVGGSTTDVLFPQIVKLLDFHYYDSKVEYKI